MQLVRDVVDRLCSRPTEVNLHDLLGKLPAPSAAGAAGTAGRTPLAGVKIAKLLQTPTEGEEEEDGRGEEGDEPSLRERLLGGQDAAMAQQRKKEEPKTSSGRPR